MANETVEVGSLILLESRYDTEILPVLRITPSGIIDLGKYKLNKNMMVRGPRERWSMTPYRGELITAERAEKILEKQKLERERQNLANELSEQHWRNFSLETLRKVATALADCDKST